MNKCQYCSALCPELFLNGHTNEECCHKCNKIFNIAYHHTECESIHDWLESDIEWQNGDITTVEEMLEEDSDLVYEYYMIQDAL